MVRANEERDGDQGDAEVLGVGYPQKNVQRSQVHQTQHFPPTSRAHSHQSEQVEVDQVVTEVFLLDEGDHGQ